MCEKFEESLHKQHFLWFFILRYTFFCRQIKKIMDIQAVNSFSKMLHLRWLTGFWIRLLLLVPVMCHKNILTLLLSRTLCTHSRVSIRWVQALLPIFDHFSKFVGNLNLNRTVHEATSRIENKYLSWFSLFVRDRYWNCNPEKAGGEVSSTSPPHLCFFWKCIF